MYLRHHTTLKIGFKRQDDLKGKPTELFTDIHSCSVWPITSVRDSLVPISRHEFQKALHKRSWPRNLESVGLC